MVAVNIVRGLKLCAPLILIISPLYECSKTFSIISTPLVVKIAVFPASQNCISFGPSVV